MTRLRNLLSKKLLEFLIVFWLLSGSLSRTLKHWKGVQAQQMSPMTMATCYGVGKITPIVGIKQYQWIVILSDQECCTVWVGNKDAHVES